MWHTDIIGRRGEGKEESEASALRVVLAQSQPKLRPPSDVQCPARSLILLLLLHGRSNFERTVK